MCMGSELSLRKFGIEVALVTQGKQKLITGFRPQASADESRKSVSCAGNVTIIVEMAWKAQHKKVANTGTRG